MAYKISHQFHLTKISIRHGFFTQSDLFGSRTGTFNWISLDCRSKYNHCFGAPLLILIVIIKISLSWMDSGFRTSVSGFSFWYIWNNSIQNILATVCSDNHVSIPIFSDFSICWKYVSRFEQGTKFCEKQRIFQSPWYFL